ncbi:hypothetical protein D3P07_19470 [Paenibacillus sp. 1011MAR3C5]|uniref:SH3 domain-containing protein n=1 Tax=Paenibacillus sp. 1011MAR3C5 TaxID=1675787 RepID=UPI000E6CBCF0|nr:SH3 domain-containing protein [Paenibacillus sp. 1011MAR3C5]RJE86254.1 hypothetical protein D3P07_19470 [Paenibacillus sp. 1011MAR3C5]
MNAAVQFEKPNEQFQAMLDTFTDRLPAEVAEELTAFVYHMRDEKYNHIKQIVDERLNPLNELFQRNDPKMDRKMRTILFIEKTNPNDMMQAIQKMVSLDPLFDGHKQFIETMASRNHGARYTRYQLDPQLKSFIQSGIHATANTAVTALKEYAHAIKAFADLLHKMKDSVGEKAFLRMGASILGGLAGGIFGSVIAREITSSLLSDEDKMIQLSNQILKKWELFAEAFDELIKSYEYSYLHITATLFGGTVLQFDRDLRKANLYMDQLSMGDYNFTVRFTEAQLLKIREWAGKSAQEIEKHMKDRKLEKALEVSEQWYQAVQHSSLLREVPFNEQFDLIYMANMYKYAVLATRALEIKGKDELEFLNLVQEIYKQMSYMVHDDDLKKIGAPQQTEIILAWTSISLKHGRAADLNVGLDYGLSMLDRSYDTGFYSGEQGYEDTAIDLETVLYMLTHFLQETYKSEHALVQKFTDLKYFPRQSALKELRSRYAVYSPDQFYKFTSKVIRLTTALSFLKPVLIRKWRVAAVLLVLLIGFLGYSQHDKIQSWLAKPAAVEITPVPESVEQQNDYLIVTTNQANIRVQPSLDAKAVSVVNHQDRLVYSNEQMEDEDGRLWYKVILKDGQAGWISSKTVQWD